MVRSDSVNKFIDGMIVNFTIITFCEIIAELILIFIHFKVLTQKQLLGIV
jgi:hypothetical protein